MLRADGLSGSKAHHASRHRDGGGRSVNPDIEIAQESEHIAEARYAEGRAALWPTLDINTTEQNQTRNLIAQGFQFTSTVPGLTVPASVGPFNTFDARLVLNQPVFDLSALRRSQAAHASIQAAKADTARTRDAVAALVAHAYARVLRENAVLEATEASIARARATLESLRTSTPPARARRSM